MAMIKAAEIHYLKANPDRPNAKYNKKNPTWEVQLRTKDPAVKKNWQAMNLNPKPVNDEDTGALLYWRVNLRKKSLKEDPKTKEMVKAPPPEIKNGALQDIDPETVGNGSIANVRIYQYEYTQDDEKKIASIFMGLQVTKHIVYVPKKRDDDFEKTDTETVAAAPMEGEDHEGDAGPEEDDESPEIAPKPKPAAPKVTSPSPKLSAPSPKLSAPSPKLAPKGDEDGF